MSSIIFSRDKILAKIKPSISEIKKESDIFSELSLKVSAIKGSHLGFIWVGSSARNTHLRNDRDLDLFILYPPSLPRSELERQGLSIGKKLLRGHFWEKAFSEHPYIRGNYKNFNVDIVPCYAVPSASQIISAVDRTPFHNSFLSSRLSDFQKDDVRLFKQFLKTIKAYGAEARYSSFPGYALELLILNYGSFENTIKAIAKWRINEFIDVAKYYSSPPDFFNHHLVIVDPVDKNRNVAAALSFNQFQRIISAANAFLAKPSDSFFFKAKKKNWSISKIRVMLSKKELIAVKLHYPKNFLQDIVWSQLKSLTKKLCVQLSLNDFIVLRSSEWTDESSVMVILFELESLSLQKIKKRFGPLASDEENAKRFLLKNKPLVVAGPRIEKGRVVIEVERKFTSAILFLSSILKKFDKFDFCFSLKNPVVLSESDLIKLCESDEDFLEFFSDYLSGADEFLHY